MRQLRTSGILFFMTAFTHITHPMGHAAEPTKIAEIEGISEYVLENGARVLLFPDFSKNKVTVNMTVFVGSRHEGYGEAGMAHLLEHMLFKGTPSHPEIPKLLSDAGAGQKFNGTTSLDRTNYYETLPASNESLELAIRLEADRLVNSFVKGEDLTTEMTVVRNEFESGENNPVGVLLQRMTAAAYEWHNYGKTTIGNRSDIERVPIIRLREFYKKFYRPDNTMMIIAGNFEIDKALEYVQKYLGSIPQPETPIDDTYTTEPAQDGERTVVLRRVGNTQVVGALYHIPAGSHPDFAAVRVIANVLADEPSGRLYKSLVEANLASNAFAFARPTHDPGMLLALAVAREDQSIEDVRQVIIDTIETGLRENPITEDEFERARQSILKERELEANDTEELAVSLSEWSSQGDWRLYFLARDMIESLTLEQVQAAAEKYLVRNNRTVGLYIPTDKADRVSIPEAPDLNNILADYKGRESVSEGEAFNPTIENIEQRTERGQLTDGIQYAFVPKKTRGESVSLLLTLRYGNADTLQDKSMVSSMMTQLMNRGTESLTYQQFQDTLVRLRAELSVSGQPGLVQFSVKTNRQNFEEVLALLIDVIRHPRFDAEDLEILKRQSLSSLEQSLNDPQALAPQSTRRILSPYPKTDVRYQPTIEESIELTKSVTVDAIKSMYQEQMSAQAGELAVVGDFDTGVVVKTLKPELANWGSEIPYKRIDRPAHPGIVGTVVSIETPDKANAVYYASQQYAVSDSNPDYAELLLGNFVLGGGSLSSRLGTKVRQEEGLSYGVGSGLSGSAQDERSEFLVYAIANPDAKNRLIAVIESVIESFAKHGMTASELASAKVGYLQQQAVSRNEDSQIAGLWVAAMFNGRDLSFYATQEREIADAELDEVNRVIAEYIDPETLVISIAGDFAKGETP
jgi:zinc protease